MGLRQAFRNKKAAREQKRRSRIEAHFNHIASILSDEIKKACQEKRSSLRYHVPKLERYNDATSFAGYRQLHRMCAARDIAIEKATYLGGSLTLVTVSSFITINFNQPYSASPDAPKKPRYEQLKLF